MWWNVIGAGAVVTKSISKPGIYVGNPAKILKEFKNEEYPISWFKASIQKYKKI